VKRWLLFALLLSPSFAFAAGGACPTPANYLSLSNPAVANWQGSVTLSSLGISSCYYVANNGADTNAGTTEGSPWAHSPGMANCASTCAGVTPGPGVGFIFRGGDEWHQHSGSILIGGSWSWGYTTGTSGTPIYFGIDPTWSLPITGTVNTSSTGNAVTWESGVRANGDFLGLVAGDTITINGTVYTIAASPAPTQSTLSLTTSPGNQTGVSFSFSSYTRPIFNQDNPLSTSAVSSGGCSFADDTTTFLPVGGTWLILDGFEFVGNCIDSTNVSTGGVDSIIDPTGGTDIITERQYLHGWTLATNVADDADVKIGNHSNSTSNTSNRHLFDVVDGSDSTFGANCNSPSCVGVGNSPPTDGATGWAFGDGNDVEYTFIQHTSQGIQAGNVCNVISDSFQYVFEPSFGGRHGNVIEHNFGSGCSTGLFYNNLFQNTNTGVRTWLEMSTGYIFNNVSINSGHTFTEGTCPACDPDGLNLSGIGSTGFNVVHYSLYNNTFQTILSIAQPENSTTPGWASGSTITFENNHIMDYTATSSFFSCSSGNTCAQTDNGGEKFMTTTVANSDGYVLSNHYAPTSGSSPTVGAGNNVTASFCATLPNANAIAACQAGTTLAVTEVPAWGGYIASYPGATANSRGVTTDAGAFQFAASGGSFTLTLTVSGTGTENSTPAGITNCTATGGTCSASFASGTVVTLTETDTLGFYLSSLSGATCGSGLCTVTMSSNQSVAATFLASSACISTAVAAPPTAAPFSGLTGAGTISFDPEPLSQGGANLSATCSNFSGTPFHLPILRATDANTSTTACTNQGTTCAPQANLGVVTDSSDGQDNNWSIDDTQFSVVNLGNNFLFVNMNPTTMALGTVYTVVGSGIGWFLQPVYSHTTPHKIYTLGSSLGNASGAVLSSFLINSPPPWTRTCLFDFSSTGGAACGGAGTTNGLPTVIGTGTTAGTSGCPASCTLTSTSGTQFPVPVTTTINGVSYSNPTILSTTLMQLPSDPGNQTGVLYSTIWTNNLFATTGVVSTQSAASGACTQFCVIYTSGTVFAGLTTITINGSDFGIAAGNTATVLHLNGPPGVHTGLAYSLDWHVTDSPAINAADSTTAADTIFGTGFGFTGTQNASAYACEYVVGSGISCINTITWQVTGDWGSTGTATCTNCSTLGSMVIHNVKFSPDGKWAFIARGSGYISPGDDSGDPNVWQVGTLNVQVCTADCTGHWGPGWTGWQTEFNTPFYYWQSYASPNSPVVFPGSYCSGTHTPFDAHASWWNGNTADAVPFITSTTTGTSNPGYSFCTQNELIGVFSPGSISLSGTILRYMHNFGAAISAFSGQNQLVTVSQTGKFAAFTSPMSTPTTSTPYLGALGDSSGNFPAASVSASRPDVFVVMLNPAPAATPSNLPVAGTYTGAQSVVISSTSPGAIICWNLTGAPETNGATGCASGSTLYTGAVSISSSETLFAVAGGTGFLDSQITSSVYTINPSGTNSSVLTPGAKLTPGAVVIQ
jgi:hypothetical protein